MRGLRNSTNLDVDRIGVEKIKGQLPRWSRNCLRRLYRLDARARTVTWSGEWWLGEEEENGGWGEGGKWWLGRRRRKMVGGGGRGSIK